MKLTPAFLYALTAFAFGRSSSAVAFPSASSDHQLSRRARGRRQCSPRHSGSLTRDIISIHRASSASSESRDGTIPYESHGVIDAIDVSRGGGESRDGTIGAIDVIGVSRGGGSGGGLSLGKGLEFASKNFFLLGMATAVSMARLAPSLGKNGSILRPEIFFGRYGVSAIFALSGLSLAFGELQNAFENVKLNAIIQFITFAVWPAIGYTTTRIIEKSMPQLLPKSLLEGLLILSCLPTTINMCILLTSTSGGSVSTALCNVVLSNMSGIVITPALLMKFFGTSAIELPFLALLVKLCKKVLLPVAIGQGLRATPVKGFYTEHAKLFKRLQEIVLLGIVWNAFANAFTSGIGMNLRDTVILLTLLSAIHVAAVLGLFAFFRQSKIVGANPGEAVAATFCGSHKTLAFGLPLINTIFDGSPNLAAYCAPIMLIHPLQLILGSLFVPYFKRSVSEGKEGQG